jgi:NAD(P)-dependent dehydrogenase (short-subunit alcohol dehydrogenase family)
MKYSILFGSESTLVKSLFTPSENDTVIRIYGNNIPSNEKYCININGASDNYIKEISQILSKAERGDSIIFVGAAFKSDESLLVSLKKNDIDKLLNLNILSYVSLVSTLLPIMIKIRSGNFIYLSSFRSINPTKGALIYSAAKAFGESFFVGIAREYGRYGVRSNVIRMGYFNGRILSSLLGGEEAIDRVRNRNALKRLGDAEDLRLAIEYCLQASFSTGGILEINGGLDFG